MDALKQQFTFTPAWGQVGNHGVGIVNDQEHEGHDTVLILLDPITEENTALATGAVERVQARPKMQTQLSNRLASQE